MKPIRINGKVVKSIYFIGIGGSSMSGLAAVLKNEGYAVSGSDKVAGEKTDRLAGMGIAVCIGQKPENVDLAVANSADLAVYTAAVENDTGYAELRRAREIGLNAIKRSELLGMVMGMYEKGIAVTGTHGKTTTTSMVTLIMIEAGMNPGVHIGSEIEALGGRSACSGGGKYFVAEADEYVNSYHSLRPFASIILNIDLDHLDFFKDIDDIKRSFTEFALLTRQRGFIVYNAADPNSVDAFKDTAVRKITFGLSELSPKLDKGYDYSARNVRFDEDGFGSYELTCRGETLCEIRLRVPGRHLLIDSIAAAALCSELNCKPEAIANGLWKYTGAKKRSEVLGARNGVTVIDDYAHHPAEVAATLEAVKRSVTGRLWCVFQPHTYTRTLKLMDDLAFAFDYADEIIVSDVYAAREPDTGLVHSKILRDRLAARGKSVRYISDFGEIAAFLAKNTRPGDKVVTMGAGDIVKVAVELLKIL